MKRQAICICVMAATGAAGAGAENLYAPGSFKPLVSDRRAERSGDTVTVLIYENSSASSSARAALQRGSDAGLQLAANGRQHGASLGTSNDFDGGGMVQRSGKLLAQMSASVTGVAENGDLWIAGQQTIEINSDKQQIRVAGRVRRTDIGDNNTVLSSRLADASITYLGDGDLAERQRPGWLARVLVWLGL